MSARGAAAGWALPGRVHPAALLLAVLLHVLAIALMLRAGHVAPPPVTVSLSLAMAPSSVVQSGARPSEALQPVAAPLPPVAASAPPPQVAAKPLPPVLSSASPAAPLAPLPPPHAIRAKPLPPALPLPPPLAPMPPPERIVPRPIPLPAPVVPHPLPPRPLAPPAPQAAGRVGPSSHPTAGPGAPAPAAHSASWLTAVSAWLDAHKFYPELAQQRGEQGTVFVRFTVTSGGRVLEVSVLRGSGSRILDRAAEDLLRGATLPPFPASMPGAETTVTFAIRYMLEQ